MNTKKFLIPALCASVALAIPMPVAAEVTVGENQTLTNNTDGTTSGSVNVSLDTSGGHWYESGPNNTDTSDNIQHQNGTYMITIPTAITFSNMPTGAANTSTKYKVNVKGVISSSDEVTLTAETGKKLTVANGTSSLTETTTQSKTVWTGEETFGNQNKDTSITGTDSDDNIAISGTVKSAGSFEGTVRYTASQLLNTQ